MSVCQYVRMQLFSLGIKMKVIIMSSGCQKILVRKSLRTAKEPALVFLLNIDPILYLNWVSLWKTSTIFGHPTEQKLLTAKMSEVLIFYSTEQNLIAIKPYFDRRSCSQAFLHSLGGISAESDMSDFWLDFFRTIP